MVDHQAGFSKTSREQYEGDCKQMFRSIMIIFAVMLLGIVACRAASPPAPPPRDFNTSDLLIDPSLLGGSWEVKSEPDEYPPKVIGFRKNLGGSQIDLRGLESDTSHIVAVFPSARDAARAWQDHDYTGDRAGRFPESWYEIDGFNYESPLADQFRVVCEEEEVLQLWDDLCVVEAQYQEFLSIIIYRNNNPSRTIDDLITLTRAVDEQMAEHLGK